MKLACLRASGVRPLSAMPQVISGVNTRRSLWVALRDPLSDRQSKFVEPSRDRISLCWYSHRANCRIIDMPESASHVGASQCIELRKLHTQRTQPIRCCSTSCAAMYAQDGLRQIWLVCSCTRAGVLADCEGLAPITCLKSVSSISGLSRHSLQHCEHSGHVVVYRLCCLLLRSALWQPGWCPVAD